MKISEAHPQLWVGFFIILLHFCGTGAYVASTIWAVEESALIISSE